MVEEAAGTRMFEERKDKAKKTMGKKEKKVQEITNLLEEEITPKLDTLRSEKRSYLQWQKACTELERVGRVLRAYEWTEAKERVAAKDKEGNPCVAPIGPGGSGHYVKMMHNGIEQGMLGALTEAWGIMHFKLGLGLDEIAGIFEQWNTEGELVRICAPFTLVSTCH